MFLPDEDAHAIIFNSGSAPTVFFIYLFIVTLSFPDIVITRYSNTRKFKIKGRNWNVDVG